MDVAARKYKSVAWLRDINLVRLYLRVARLSEITNSTGTHLLSEHQTRQHQYHKSLHWPSQVRPGQRVWARWNQFIRSTFCHPKSSALLQPLGTWHRTVNLIHQHVYDPDTDAIGQWSSGNNYDYYAIQRPDRFTWRINLLRKSFSDTAPSHGIPLDSPRPSNPKTVVRYTARPSLRFHQRPRPCQRLPSSTFITSVRRLPAWEQDLIRYFSNLSSDHLAILETDSPLYIVSDGGNVTHHGTYGWTIATEREILFEGWGLARGTPMQSHRAEAYGMLNFYTASTGMARTIRVFSHNLALVSTTLQLGPNLCK